MTIYNVVLTLENGQTEIMGGFVDESNANEAAVLCTEHSDVVSTKVEEKEIDIKDFIKGNY